jgi:hypothetical protein
MRASQPSSESEMVAQREYAGGAARPAGYRSAMSAHNQCRPYSAWLVQLRLQRRIPLPAMYTGFPLRLCRKLRSLCCDMRSESGSSLDREDEETLLSQDAERQGA